MLARLLMNLVADVIFRSAGTRSRAYEAEIDRYLDARGIVLDRKGATLR
jgi:hypothetical protein